MPGDCNCQGTQVKGHACSEQIICSGVNTDIAGKEKLDVNVCTLQKGQTLPVAPAKVKIEYFDNLMNSSSSGINGFAGAGVSAVTVKNEIPSDFADDDLDHIVLKQRRKMLLSRCPFVFSF